MAGPGQRRPVDVGSDVPWNDEFRYMVKVEVAQALCEELPEMVNRISARLIVRLGTQIAKEKNATQTAVKVEEEPDKEKVVTPPKRRYAQKTVPPAPTDATTSKDRGKRKCEEELHDPYLIVKCYKCKHMGHYATQCSGQEGKVEGSTKAKIRLKKEDQQCSMCGESGHTKKNCILQIYRLQRFRSG